MKADVWLFSPHVRACISPSISLSLYIFLSLCISPSLSQCAFLPPPPSLFLNVIFLSINMPDAIPSAFLHSLSPPSISTPLPFPPLHCPPGRTTKARRRDLVRESERASELASEREKEKERGGGERERERERERESRDHSPFLSPILSPAEPRRRSLSLSLGGKTPRPGT